MPDYAPLISLRLRRNITLLLTYLHMVTEMHGVWVLGLPTFILPNIKERQIV